MVVEQPPDESRSLPGASGGVDNSNVFRKFVQEHLKSFLKPIAEHVEELKAEVADVRLLMRSLQGTLHEQLSGCEGKLASLQQQLSTFAAEQEKENSSRAHELTTAGRRLDAVEGACTDAVSGLQRAAVRLGTHSNGIEDLKQALENTNSNLNRLQLKHWQTQGLAQQVESALAELKDEHTALGERSSGLARSLAQMQLGAETQRLALGDLETKVDGVAKRACDQADSLGNKLLIVDRTLGRLKQVQLEQAKEVMPLASELRRLSQAVGRLEDEVEAGNQVEDSDGTRMPSEHAHVHRDGRAVADVDAAIQEIRQIAQNGGDKKYQEMVISCANRVKQVSDELSEIVPIVRVNTAAVSSHQEHLHELEGRVREQENRQSMAQERINRAEGDITNLNSSFHDVQSKMQSLGSEMDKTQGGQSRLLKELSEAQTVIRGHDADLKASESSLQALQNRVEGAYEYLHGLGKGFQDTHRSVLAGHDGLLAPRPTSAQKGALPALTVPAPRMNVRLTEFVRPGTSPPVLQRPRASLGSSQPGIPEAFVGLRSESA